MRTEPIPKGFDSYIQKWRGKYKHINYTVCFHTSPNMQKGEYPDLYPDEGIWNGYISINKQSIPNKFDSLIPKIKRYGKRKHYDYNSLDDIFDFGITYFELMHGVGSEVVAFEVGNDYCHSWNHGTDMLDVVYDIKKAIDKFIHIFPKYKAWSSENGNWIIAKNIEKYNEKMRMKRISQ